MNKWICVFAAFGLVVPASFGQLHLNQPVSKAPVTVTLASSGPSSVSGSVKVVPNPGQGTMNAPTGTVTLLETDTAIAPDVLIPTTGTFTFDTSSLSAGVHVLTAQYSGDTEFLAGSTPQRLSLTVPGPDFAITVDQLTATVKQGGAWTANVILTSTNGFTGRVNLSCGALPAKMTCGFGSPFLIGGPTPDTTSVSFATVATTLATLSGLLLIGCGTRRRSLWSRCSRRSRVCFLSLALVLVTGCGINMRYEQTDGTPKGIYSVDVFGTNGADVRKQTVTITVN